MKLNEALEHAGGPYYTAEMENTIRKAAHAYQTLIEKVKAGGRIEIVVPCSHGLTNERHLIDGAHPESSIGYCYEPVPRVDVTEKVMG